MSILLWLLSLLPPAFFGASNLLDKIAVHGDDEDNSPWAIVAMGALFDIVFVLPIGIYCWVTGSMIPLGVFVPLFLNGITFTFAGWLFYHSIKVEEASRVVPIFQVIPAFGFVLGFYGLEEKLGVETIFAIFLLMIGGFTLSLKKGKINRNILAMMLVSSLLYAVNDFVLAEYGRRAKDAIWAVILADLLGKMFFGMIGLLNRKDRNSFVLGFKTKFKLVALSSIVYSVGDLMFDVAKLFVPIAIVQALCCTQPLFVLFGAVVLTIFYKKFPKEEIDGASLWRKSVGIVFMVVGGILLSI